MTKVFVEHSKSRAIYSGDDLIVVQELSANGKVWHDRRVFDRRSDDYAHANARECAAKINANRQ